MNIHHTLHRNLELNRQTPYQNFTFDKYPKNPSQNYQISLSFFNNDDDTTTNNTSSLYLLGSERNSHRNLELNRQNPCQNYNFDKSNENLS